MRNRLTLACLATAAALAASVPAVHSAFSASTRTGTSEFAAAAAFAPRTVTLPAITGTAREDETLTATTGTWARGPVSLKVEWLRCTEADACTVVSTGTTRKLTADDIGRRMRVRVTATNAAGSTSATSARTAVVLAGPPVNTALPAISGSATVNHVLTVSDGTWLRATGTPSYRWLRCTTTSCTPIPNETSDQLLLTAEHAGATIQAEVTYASVTATSSATAAVGRETYTHILCSDPQTGVGVAPDGTLPDGWTHFDTLAVSTSPAANTRCAGSGAGIPLSTNGSYTTTTPDDRTWVQYRAPADVRFAGATVYRHGTMSGHWSWSFQFSDATGIFSPTAELCSWGHGCTTLGSATPRFGGQNRVDVAAYTANGFNMTLACDIGWGQQCVADGSQVIRFFGGTAKLRDTTTPTVTIAPTGSLASADPLPAVGIVNVTAVDEGAGLYRVRVLLDDTEVAAKRVAENAGRCNDHRPGSADPYEFAYQVPCPLSVNTSVPFDTTGWPRGRHRLRVLLEDAGQNSVALVDRSVTLA